MDVHTTMAELALWIIGINAIGAFIGGFLHAAILDIWSSLRRRKVRGAVRAAELADCIAAEICDYYVIDEHFRPEATSNVAQRILVILNRKIDECVAEATSK